MTRQADRTQTKERTFAALRSGIALCLLLAVAACNGGGPQSGESVVDGTVHVCSSCHGLEGRSISPTFPNLAGQQHDYIVAQLQAFRDHTRADPHAHTYMWGMAAKLSDATIDGVATHYSSQTPAPGTPGDPALVAAGKKIFEEGIPDRDVPVCANCHGEKAQGDALFPRLAGQHPSYIQSQLLNFQTLARNNELMHQNSLNLTPEEIGEVAAYVGSL
jgi:cytochrome c553